MKKYVIIVAGGKGLRMGSDLPKQFLPVGGKPVLMHTLEVFRKYDAAIQLILVLPREQQDFWKQLCPRFSGYAREQLERFCEILRGKIETVEIRGVD